jgi:hypothetical protein
VVIEPKLNLCSGVLGMLSSSRQKYTPNALRYHSLQSSSLTGCDALTPFEMCRSIITLMLGRSVLVELVVAEQAKPTQSTRMSSWRNIFFLLSSYWCNEFGPFVSSGLCSTFLCFCFLLRFHYFAHIFARGFAESILFASRRSREA